MRRQQRLLTGSLILASIVAVGCTKTSTPPAGKDPAKPADSGAKEAPPAPIDLSGYDLGCKVDTDCVVVHPQPCAKCGCPDQPIAKTEEARFVAAIDAVECPDHDPWPDVDCGSCMEKVAYCDAGTHTCKARWPED